MAMCERKKPTVPKTEEAVQEAPAVTGEEKKNMVMVGKPAPLFTAPAYHKGEFKDINLEDYIGEWIMLCFYPGDFTFV
jgi:hypothetical protein